MIESNEIVLLEEFKDVKKTSIIVLDIETTGLSPQCDMICEIGICLLNLETGKINPHFSKVCQEKNKEFDEHSWVFQNSDLTFEDVINAPYFSEFQKEIQNLFNLEIPITAYNQQFDFGFLEYRGMKIPNKFWDPMLKLTPILKIPGFYQKYKWPSVQEAWNFFFGTNNNYHEAHRALDDAMHEAQILFKTYKYLQKRIKFKRIKAKESKGFRHQCGHFCANTSNHSHCCRCQNPKNGYSFIPTFSICKICWGTMKKYADGFYFQKCPVCDNIVQTTKDCLPILAPMQSCSIECLNRKESEKI
ncbi:MAG: exonuclease domain-containing protein [Promethearchaeota archaeon]